MSHSLNKYCQSVSTCVDHRKHGVRVLGTIITEWAAGKELLERILVSDEIIETFATVTARMCAHYGFHGWLLNIENAVEPDLVLALIKLTQSLTQAVRKQVGEEGRVLWYDSVTIKVIEVSQSISIPR